MLKLPYKAPKVINEERNDVSTNRYAITYRYSSPIGNLYSRELTERQKDLILNLHSNGLMVEELFLSRDKFKGRSEILFRDAGMSLVDVFNEASFSERKALVSKVVEILVTLHLNGVVHKHPHFNNFVLDKNGALRIIDFKLAKSIEVDWKSSRSVLDAFSEDYFYLLRSLVFRFNKITVKRYLRKLISSYPMSGISKLILYTLILSKFKGLFKSGGYYGW